MGRTHHICTSTWRMSSHEQEQRRSKSGVGRRITVEHSKGGSWADVFRLEKLWLHRLRVILGASFLSGGGKTKTEIADHKRSEKGEEKIHDR